MNHETNRAPAAPEQEIEQVLLGTKQQYDDRMQSVTNEGIPEQRWSKEAEMLESWAAPVPASTGRDSGCRMTGGICACRSGGSFGGCVRERENCCAVDARHDNETGRRVYDDPHGRVAAKYPVAARELDADAERRAFEAYYMRAQGFSAPPRRSDAGEPSRTYLYTDAELCFKTWIAARATAESAPASAAPPDQAAFETQAKYQGATNFTPVHPEFLVCNNGWFPATYRDPMTELAWRVWANKRAPSNSSPAGAKEQDK